MINVVTPSALSFAISVGIWVSSGEALASTRIDDCVGGTENSASTGVGCLCFFISARKNSLSKLLECRMPSLRGWPLSASPAYWTLPLPSPWAATTSAVTWAKPFDWKIGVRRGDGATYGTPAFSSACWKTCPPPTPVAPVLDARSSTANGFMAAIVTASARWAASSWPVDLTKTSSTWRPHVSYTCSNTALLSIAALRAPSGSAPCVDWFTKIPVVDSPGGSSFHSTTVFTVSAVTPCATAPPLSPPFQAFTHGGAA